MLIKWPQIQLKKFVNYFYSQSKNPLNLVNFCTHLFFLIKIPGKSPKFVDEFKMNLANEPKLFISQMNANLAKNSPKIWAFWTKLIFDLQIGQNIW